MRREGSHDEYARIEALEPRLLLSTVYTVDSLADNLDTDGVVTLREGLQAANTDAPVGDAPAGSGDDVITFDAALSGGTITLNAGLGRLDIDSNVDIQGLGADQLTIDAAGNTRVFYVTGNVTDAAISAMTITGGDTSGEGGAICNDGDLTITTSTISGSSGGYGGGVYNWWGTLTITNTTISGNSGGYDGGAVYNDGTLTITNSTISGNSAHWGGGIYNDGTLTTTNTTVRGNLSGKDGGGIYNDDTLTITNTTISGNSSGEDGGGIANYHGTLTMTNTTITDNRTDSDDSGSEDGGGVYVDAGTVTLHNTIVSSNVRGSAAPVADDVSGTLEVGSSYNLIGDAGSGGGLTDGVNGNIVGADPLLGPLDYYYYHSPTRTYPLLSSSPALDTGSNSRANDAGLTTDQRGVDRFYDGDDNGTATVDIGAYEFYVFPGDWDGDGFVEGDDIDELFDNFGNPQYDLDGDGETDTDDVGYVLHDVLNTEWGDANLDGKVNVGDLGIFASNYGSSGLGWGGGDYTGDGTINVGDLGILAANYGFETSPGGGAAGGGIVGVGGGTFVVTETPILDVSVFPPAEVYVAPPAEVDTVISPDPQGQDSSNPDPSVELLTILLLGVLPPI